MSKEQDNILSPKQIEFFKHFLDKKSPTFSNITQSAIKAGYSESFAKNLTSIMPKWLSETIGDEKIIKKAEKNLEMALDGLLDDPERGKREIQYKATEFSLRTLKREKYSERKEHTGKDGEPITIIQREKIEKALDNL